MNANKVHDWKNHISPEVRGIWHTFTYWQKQAIARHAEKLADAEEWD